MPELVSPCNAYQPGQLLLTGGVVAASSEADPPLLHAVYRQAAHRNQCLMLILMSCLALRFTLATGSCLRERAWRWSALYAT